MAPLGPWNAVGLSEARPPTPRQNDVFSAPLGPRALKLKHTHAAEGAYFERLGVANTEMHSPVAPDEQMNEYER